jgi:hypothetical protein
MLYPIPALSTNHISAFLVLSARGGGRGGALLQPSHSFRFILAVILENEGWRSEIAPIENQFRLTLLLSFEMSFHLQFSSLPISFHPTFVTLSEFKSFFKITGAPPRYNTNILGPMH